MPDHPDDPQASPFDQRTEVLISRLLRAGVWTSLALLAAGTTLSFLTGSYTAADPQTLFAPPTTPADAGRITLLVGLISLLITPVLRVLVSLLTFVLQRDWPFVWITSAVLALLAISFALGAAH